MEIHLHHSIDLKRVLVVEDEDTDYLPDAFFVSSIKSEQNDKKRKEKFVLATTCEGGIARLQQHPPPLAVILDMKLPKSVDPNEQDLADADAAARRPVYRIRDFLEALWTSDAPHPRIILVSMYDDINKLPADATQEIQRHFDNGTISAIVSKQSLNMCRLNVLLHVNSIFEHWHLAQHSAPHLIGDSEPMRILREKIAQIADDEGPVLIQGPTGSGKELVAEAIHQASAISGELYQVVDCGALQETLLNSQLFGHVKGIFPGAQEHMGLFEYLDGGMIFLDEIHNLSREAQGKLLRVLDKGEVRLTGANKTIHVTVRVICATNVDLDKRVEEGHFRFDLLQRIRVHTINTPPLLDYIDDVEQLASHLLEQQVLRVQMRQSMKPRDKQRPKETYPTTFTRSAIKTMQKYSWPDNVRGLKNEIVRIVAHCKKKTVDVGDLSATITGYVEPPEDDPGPNSVAVRFLSEQLDLLKRCSRVPIDPAVEEVYKTWNHLESHNNLLDGLRRTMPVLDLRRVDALCTVLDEGTPRRSAQLKGLIDKIEDDVILDLAKIDKEKTDKDRIETKRLGVVRDLHGKTALHVVKTLFAIAFSEGGYTRQELATILSEVLSDGRIERHNIGFTNPITDVLIGIGLLRQSGSPKVFTLS